MLSAVVLKYCAAVVCVSVARSSDAFSVIVKDIVVGQSKDNCTRCWLDSSTKPKDPVQFKWLKGESEVTEDKDRITITSDESNSNRLCLINVANASVLGKYTCAATFQGETMSGEGTVSSLPFSKKWKFFRSKSVVEGNSLTLECRFWGLPVPSVTWLRDVNPMEYSRARVTLLSNSSDGVHSQLELQNVVLEDRGKYRCQARNDNGVTSSRPILARIKGKLLPLWSFMGFFVEMVIVIVIIIFSVKTTKKGASKVAPKSAMSDKM